MEVLHVAMGEIYVQTINAADTAKVKKSIQSFMDYLSNGLKTLKSEVPGLISICMLCYLIK